LITCGLGGAAGAEFRLRTERGGLFGVDEPDPDPDACCPFPFPFPLAAFPLGPVGVGDLEYIAAGDGDRILSEGDVLPVPVPVPLPTPVFRVPADAETGGPARDASGEDRAGAYPTPLSELCDLLPPGGRIALRGGVFPLFIRPRAPPVAAVTSSPGCGPDRNDELGLGVCAPCFLNGSGSSSAKVTLFWDTAPIGGGVRCNDLLEACADPGALPLRRPSR